MKITPAISRLINLGLVEPTDSRQRIIPTELAKRELRALLRRRNNPSYWHGVLSTYALLSETELLEQHADIVDRKLRRMRR